MDVLGMFHENVIIMKINGYMQLHTLNVFNHYRLDSILHFFLILLQRINIISLHIDVNTLELDC